MDKINIKIFNKTKGENPNYETIGSAGMDLKANIDVNHILYPMERFLVPTGIHIDLPAGYEAQVRPRSGLALKKGITCLNSPGTIDSDYRGEIHALLINLSKETFEIKKGDRIAQLVVAKYSKVNWINLLSEKELTDTDRGSGGFGSTGE